MSTGTKNLYGMFFDLVMCLVLTFVGERHPFVVSMISNITTPFLASYKDKDSHYDTYSNANSTKKN